MMVRIFSKFVGCSFFRSILIPDDARQMVIEHHQDALQAAQRWALKSDTTDAQNLVLSLVFNLTNDYGTSLNGSHCAAAC